MAITAAYTFPEISDIIKDKTVIRQMDDAWDLMKKNASTIDRYEFGFYIYYNHLYQSFYVGNIDRGLPVAGCQGTKSKC